MSDANELVNAMKRAALDAMEASKPVNLVFGEVVSISPLQITVEQKMILGVKQLALSRNVTEYTVKTTGGGIQDEITIHNSLAVGDEVILMRQQGGQKFIVLDKVGK